MSEWFIGSGIAYPMRIGPSGGIALASHDEEIAESMRLILGTSPGRAADAPRVRVPDPRAHLRPRRRHHDRADRLRGANSLQRWEPRIEVLDVEVTVADDQPSLLYIDVSYAVRDTNDRRNLVFPFYVIPEEE